MTRDEFLALLEEIHQEIVGLNKTKGHDYAGDEDALSNFKEMGRVADLPPERIWQVYAGKHWAAIMTYCKEGQVQSEPIEGRIKDLILYGYLLLGLVKEKERTLAPSQIMASDPSPGIPDPELA
jgi:hypothetical protein